MAEPPKIPSPEPPKPKPIATRLAYGESPWQTDGTYTYRLERGFPFQRAGKSVVVSSTLATLRLNTGSAVGLHTPVNQNALTGGLIDPSKPGVLQIGSTVPTFVTVPFTFNATSTTALTISWPAWPIRRANKTLTTASDTTIPAGSISLTGLTANTQYFYYPFWSEVAKVLGWAGAGNSTSAGSPAIAQTAQADATVQAAFFQGFVPLNVLTFTQPAAGTLSQTGGYGSGNPKITGGARGYNTY
jgi:hypothetical protein